MNSSLIFWEPRFSKSHRTPDVVYVPINSSLQFVNRRFTKSYTTPDELVITVSSELKPGFQFNHGINNK